MPSSSFGSQLPSEACVTYTCNLSNKDAEVAKLIGKRFSKSDCVLCNSLFASSPPNNCRVLAQTPAFAYSLRHGNKWIAHVMLPVWQMRFLMCWVSSQLHHVCMCVCVRVHMQCLLLIHLLARAFSKSRWYFYFVNYPSVGIVSPQRITMNYLCPPFHCAHFSRRQKVKQKIGH